MQHARIDSVNPALQARADAPGNVVEFRGRRMSGELKGEGGLAWKIGETHAKVEILLDRAEEDRAAKLRTDAEVSVRMAAQELQHVAQASRLTVVEADVREIRIELKAINENIQAMRWVAGLKTNARWLVPVVVSTAVFFWTIVKPWYDQFVAGFFHHVP